MDDKNPFAAVSDDLVEAGPPFFFDRYINGVRMAEDVCVERETTLEGAMRVAARIAAKGPNGEPPVLVYRSTETAALITALLARIAAQEAQMKAYGERVTQAEQGAAALIDKALAAATALAAMTKEK